MVRGKKGKFIAPGEVGGKSAKAFFAATRWSAAPPNNLPVLFPSNSLMHFPADERKHFLCI